MYVNRLTTKKILKTRMNAKCRAVMSGTTFIFSPTRYYFITEISVNREFKGRRRGLVVRALDLKSGGPGFKSRSDHLDFFHGSPVFKSKATLCK